MVEIEKGIKCNNENYEKGRNDKIRYIVVHYTAGVNDTAKGNAIYFRDKIVEASAHYFVDERGIYQSVEDKDTAWHCGGVKYYSKCRNENSIGIELCSRKLNEKSKNAEDKDWYFAEKTKDNAIELIRYLMGKYDIKEVNVIRHYDVTRKLCPAPFVHYENSWRIFKNRIKEEGDEMVIQGTMTVNGKDIKIDKIVKGGSTFVKIRNLESAGFKIDYDSKTKNIILDNR